jgi:hypothetical protein
MNLKVVIAFLNTLLKNTKREDYVLSRFQKRDLPLKSKYLRKNIIGI